MTTIDTEPSRFPWEDVGFMTKEVSQAGSQPRVGNRIGRDDQAALYGTHMQAGGQFPKSPGFLVNVLQCKQCLAQAYE